MQAIANLIISIVVLIVGSLIHHISPSIGQYALVVLVSILAGAVFLSLGQALVGLVKSADSIQAVARVLFAVLILLGLLGQSGALGSFWSSIARWTPVGAVMTLFAGVLNLHAWSSRDTFSVLACLAYIIVFAGVGIRWFQWDAR
jgi:ABC-2 type transport system permease protein